MSSNHHFARSNAEAEIKRIAANFEACAKSVVRQAHDPKEHERQVQRSLDAIAFHERKGFRPSHNDPLAQRIHDRKVVLLCN